MADLISNLALGFGVALHAGQPAVLPDRRAGRHAGRRAAGHRRRWRRSRCCCRSPSACRRSRR
ncbi:MAG: hypothetical protein MZV49_08430 [Rhodopseudomonas palustris]|nr:hypothetical protein [Rhodopseudomonas palustris]